jgi:oligoendopeptidase F
MTLAALLALSVAAAGPVAATAYRIDLSHYEANAAAEPAQRAHALAQADAFVTRAGAALSGPTALLTLLQAHDALCRLLRRHGIAVQLRASENVDDHASAQAEGAIDAAVDQVDAALQRAIASVGAERAARYESAEPALAPYHFAIARALRQPVVSAADERASVRLARPALDNLAQAYGGLRRAAQSAAAASAPGSPADRAAAAAAGTRSPGDGEAAFAALLGPIVALREGDAQLRGYAHAEDAAYADQQTSAAQVHAVLAAVRAQAGAYARFSAVVARAAVRRLRVAPADVKAEDLDLADAWRPPVIAFPDAVPLILAGAGALGHDYQGEFERLFDRAAGRVDWCHGDKCDDVGFSVGYAGSISGLFYGRYSGDTNSLRATAHEAAHAVHRQLMNEHQPVAAFNEGPHFLFEAFAIFNELLFLEHLQRSAPTRASQAFYLHRLLDDATFQVFGSAFEVDLEERLHARLRDGAWHDAAELDELTLDRASAWLPPQRMKPDVAQSWARNRLYFTDPFYDTNYLLAGVIALACLRAYEQDPQGFAPRYVALLGNGFDDTPQALLKRFLGLDLDDADALVQAAIRAIDERTTALAALYDADDAPTAGASR